MDNSSQTYSLGYLQSFLPVSPLYNKTFYPCIISYPHELTMFQTFTEVDSAGSCSVEPALNQPWFLFLVLRSNRHQEMSSKTAVTTSRLLWKECSSILGKYIGYWNSINSLISTYLSTLSIKLPERPSKIYHP